MPIAWYIVPYVRLPNIVVADPDTGETFTLAQRTVALNVDAPQLEGKWREVEVLGNRAIVKINVGAGVLSQLDAAYTRIPKNSLDDSLSSLSNGAKTALRNLVLDAGYTAQEVQNRFGSDLGVFTLRDVLKFMATRKCKPQFDRATDALTYDGAIIGCEDIDALDKVIT